MKSCFLFCLLGILHASCTWTSISFPRFGRISSTSFLKTFILQAFHLSFFSSFYAYKFIAFIFSLCSLYKIFFKKMYHLLSLNGPILYLVFRSYLLTFLLCTWCILLIRLSSDISTHFFLLYLLKFSFPAAFHFGFPLAFLSLFWIIFSYPELPSIFHSAALCALFPWASIRIFFLPPLSSFRHLSMLNLSDYVHNCSFEICVLCFV